ncbi:MAG: hypothetical protein FWD53_08465, partial [Phycisphaerales bacterium]|nr:hypothetical protein [Phycisphaerales bacterium]
MNDEINDLDQDLRQAFADLRPSANFENELLTTIRERTMHKRFSPMMKLAAKAIAAAIALAATGVAADVMIHQDAGNNALTQRLVGGGGGERAMALTWNLKALRGSVVAGPLDDTEKIVIPQTALIDGNVIGRDILLMQIAGNTESYGNYGIASGDKVSGESNEPFDGPVDGPTGGRRRHATQTNEKWFNPPPAPPPSSVERDKASVAMGGGDGDKTRGTRYRFGAGELTVTGGGSVSNTSGIISVAGDLIVHNGNLTSQVAMGRKPV